MCPSLPNGRQNIYFRLRLEEKPHMRTQPHPQV
ncbi:hypothetical protein MTBLM5_410014 [Magnetospirillum sp. LM-5]|nr:hypothetical protein MTBLM5_410014 [Magnetospirillum sp. LM-5]